MFIITSFLKLLFPSLGSLINFYTTPFSECKINKIDFSLLRYASMVWSFIMNLKKINDQNSNFPIDILTENNEGKILKQISVVANLVCEEIES